MRTEAVSFNLFSSFLLFFFALICLRVRLTCLSRVMPSVFTIEFRDSFGIFFAQSFLLSNACKSICAHRGWWQRQKKKVWTKCCNDVCKQITLQFHRSSLHYCHQSFCTFRSPGFKQVVEHKTVFISEFTPNIYMLSCTLSFILHTYPELQFGNTISMQIIQF